MIRLETLRFRGNADLVRSWLPEWDEFGPEGDHSLIRLIRHNEIPSGLMSAVYENDTVTMKIFFPEGTDDRRKLMAVITERIIRRFHPAKIVIPDADQNLVPVLEANSYHGEGNSFLKDVEPWRKILNDAVFDDEGFIINQGRMKDIPFGWFKTDAKGCGWIAAWNLLKMNGRETTMEICAHGLEKHAFLGEMMGQDLFRLSCWLKKQGLNVSVSLPLNSAAEAMISKSRSGIILYSHSRGAHYVAFRRVSDTKIQIFNAVYGRRGHVLTAREFLKQFPLFPTTIVIGVK